MSDNELRNAVARLWEAANNHCITFYGEFLDPEWEGEDNPPCPDGPLDVIEAVEKHLRSAG